MKWFRFYSEALDDPKVQRLSPALFKHWINLLCIVSENEPRGYLPDNVEDVAFKLRVKPSRAKRILSQLVDAGLFETQDGRYFSHNWTLRQRESDDSAPRVRRYRERKAEEESSDDRGFEAQDDDTVTEDVTLQSRTVDTDTDTDIDTPPTPSERGKRKPKAIRNRHRNYPPGFLTFWESYPRKVDKPTACDIWQALVDDGVSPDDLIASARNYAAEMERQGTEKRYMKHCTTFLNNSWEDFVAQDTDNPDDEYQTLPTSDELFGPGWRKEASG